MKSLTFGLAISTVVTLLSGCAAPPNYHYTNVRYIDSFNGASYQTVERSHGHNAFSPQAWGSAQYQTRLLRQAQVSRGAVLADDSHYGVSAFSFVNCGVVDLVGSDGMGLFSVAQPVCTTTTSTLSELDVYPR